MADDNEEEEESGGGKKKMIIIGVVVLAALGGAYQFVLKPPPPEEAVEAVDEEPELVEGEIVQMEELILNTAGEPPGFLRVGLAVVLEEGVAMADFEIDQPIAQDIAVEYLSSLTTEELRAPGGRQAAKEELGSLMRAAYDDSTVVRVLFTSFVMQ